jgi:hypothetical protein
MVGYKVQDDAPWSECTATVIDCKRTFETSVDETAPRDDIYVLPEYIVTFEYQVNAETYSGKYRSGWPVEDGHEFTILYDPGNPTANTGSDALYSAWNIFLRKVGYALGWIIAWVRD